MDDKNPIINISDVLEYEFCPRFIYFIYCLDIPQHEELRFKVLEGREIHKKVTQVNRNYIRKKIGAQSREFDVFLASQKYHFKGILDEILFLNDGKAAPLEYKFAEYKDNLFRTTKSQLILQSILIEENYGKKVDRSFVCYVRSNHKLVEMDIRQSDVDKVKAEISDILNIIRTGFYPKTKKNINKCTDCCYRNICT
ncbi:CRISPR-associated exonuclease Cas4 [Methanomicrobium sp. W14]|uniref:CRISPR-associated protein Cas4 n=1 Tax=Methanomicrobium sp. W14 TaxID=2817839 RepID=UPI001FD8B010|nr:CRISPR-associated protein Cas4 [Methanomicrobium sp. W14]MBP2133622.1 CRISPR-associated exonuclease Cas4 [Methanomicrobium sp. W14]